MRIVLTCRPATQGDTDPCRNGAPDSGTFFIKTAKRSRRHASYSHTAFYEAWRLVIQRYGIHNPYNGRGAIRGPAPARSPQCSRCARDPRPQANMLCAGRLAIQDAPEMVAQLYGRFLPQDKSALAAKVLNRVWQG